MSCGDNFRVMLPVERGRAKVDQPYLRVLDAPEIFLLKINRVQCKTWLTVHVVGSGCGYVGRAVTVRIKSLVKNITNIFTVNCIEKTKIKKKWSGMTHILKNRLAVLQCTKSHNKNELLALPVSLPTLYCVLTYCVLTYCVLSYCVLTYCVLTYCVLTYCVLTNFVLQCCT